MTKEREVVKKVGIKKIVIGLGIGLIAICGTVAAGVSINKHQEKMLIAETPLQDYSIWYSLDHYPKFKLEAAKRVDELMKEGKEQTEACEIAVEELSDKIYEDTVQFIENEYSEYDWDDEIPDFEESYLAYLKETQQ